MLKYTPMKDAQSDISLSFTMTKMDPEVSWCTICAEKGKTVVLKSFQINLEEATLLCPEKNCTYPIGSSNVVIRPRPCHNLIRKRKSKDTVKSQKKSRLNILGELPEDLLLPAHNLNPPKKTLDTEKSTNHDKFVPKPVPRGKTNSNANSHTSQQQLLCSSIQQTTLLEESVVSSVEVNLFWKNKAALCWLDVVMCYLVKSQLLKANFSAMQNMPKSCIGSLMKNYTDCKEKYRSVLEIKRQESKIVGLETSVGRVPVKTGGGDPLSLLFSFDQYENSGFSTHEDLQLLPLQRGHTKQHLTEKRIVMETDLNKSLETAREEVWQFLQPKLKCVKGKNDSPVFALDLLIRNCAVTSKLSNVDYCWRMTCSICSYKHEDCVRKPVVTFPAVPPYFNMERPCFLRDCFSCGTPRQTLMMTFNRLPPMLFIHFVDGLHSSALTDYDFSYKADAYAVTGAIQYLSYPDHFVVWIRNPLDNTWLQYNDLVSEFAQTSAQPPNFSPVQVHIMIWEKQARGTGYSRPEKSTNFVQMTKSIIKPADKAPVQRIITPVSSQVEQNLTKSQVFLSHLRPVAPIRNTPGTNKIPLAPSPAPQSLGDHASVTKPLTAQQRLEKMRARFKLDKNQAVDPVTSGQINTSSHQAVSSQKSNLQSERQEKQASKWLTKSPKGSYLEAFKPYLKKSIGLKSEPKSKKTFEGYIPKAKLKQQLEEQNKPSPAVAEKSVPKPTPHISNTKSTTAPKHVVKLKKHPSKSVSFFDRDGFRIPGSPVSPRGARKTVSKPVQPGTVKNLSFMAEPIANSSSALRANDNSSRSHMNAVPCTSLNTGSSLSLSVQDQPRMTPPMLSPTSLLTGSANLSSIPIAQDMPLDLSPTRNTSKSPASSNITNFIDQLCSDLPTDLEMSSVQRSTNQKEEIGELFGSFGLTADEMAVMETLSNTLMPDEYSLN